MSNISGVGIVICIIMTLFFLQQLMLFIGTFKKKYRRRMPLHFMGTVTTFLVTFCVIVITFGQDITSTKLVMATIILSVLFFFVYGFNSLLTIRKK